MGNCINEDFKMIDMGESYSPTRKKITHFKILEEIKQMPVLDQKIKTRLQQLKPFFKIKPPSSNRTYRLNEGAFYQGSIKRNTDTRQIDGPGRMLLADGTLIESEFQNGRPANTTRIFKPNGDYFSGELSMKDGKSFGIIEENGIKYEGELLKNRPHGKGSQKCEKFVFQGEYKNGKKVSGLLKWNLEHPKHQYSYEGEFKNEKFHGHGTLKDNNGTYCGMFKQGQKHGKGNIETHRGKSYEGTFSSGVLVQANATNSTSSENKNKYAREAELRKTKIHQ